MAATTTISLDIHLTPEARALADELKRSNDLMDEVAGLLKSCRTLLEQNHASLRQMPAEFLQKVGLECSSRLKAGAIDESLPAAGVAGEGMGSSDIA